MDNNNARATRGECDLKHFFFLNLYLIVLYIRDSGKGTLTFHSKWSRDILDVAVYLLMTSETLLFSAVFGSKEKQIIVCSFGIYQIHKIVF